MSSLRYKKGFTLREVLVIVIIISVGLLSVLVALTRGMTYVQQTRQKVVALALAKEGMEAVYHIRDTNWTRWAGIKDRCRITINPMESLDGKQCRDDQRFTSGYYILQRLTSGGEQYFALTGNFAQGVDISDGIGASDTPYALCQDGGYRDSCTGSISTTEEGIYFRQIQGYGLYLKDVAQTGGSLLVCSGGLSPECAAPSAKEFRFCSTVIYVGYTTGEVQLCGVLTNFEQ